MAAFISWCLIIALVGWLTFPLVYSLFPALADRGYSLARAAGLLVWGYAYWLLNSLGLLQNNVGGVLFSLLVVVALSAASPYFSRSTLADRRTEIAGWLRSHLRLVVAI